MTEQPGCDTAQAFDEGSTASRSGKGFDACPYIVATHPWSRKAWGDGWEATKRELYTGGDF